jgi:hypothetical protein
MLLALPAVWIPSRIERAVVRIGQLVSASGFQ